MPETSYHFIADDGTPYGCSDYKQAVQADIFFKEGKDTRMRGGPEFSIEFCPWCGMRVRKHGVL